MLIAALVVGGAGLASPAVAQAIDPYRADRPADVTAAIPLSERPRPDVAPIGGRFGSFFLYPTLDVGAVYDDNVLGGYPRRQGDAALSLRAGAQLVSRWSRHRLEIDGYGLVNRYAARAEQDSTGYGAHGAGRYDVGRDTRLEGDVRFDRAPEDRLDVNTASGSVTPIAIATRALSVRVDRRFGGLALTARVQQLDSRYGDGRDVAGLPLPQNYRDNDRGIYTGLLRYELHGGISLIVAAAYDELSYRQAVPLDRDSTGMRVEAGVGLELADRLTGEVRLGYLRRRNASPLLRNPQGIAFSAGIIWAPVARVTLKLDATRDVEDAASPLIAGNLRSEGRLALDDELSRNLLLGVSLRVARVDPIGIDGANTETEEGAQAQYIFSRRYRLTLRMRHVDRSAGEYPPLHATRASATFGVTL